MHTYLYIVVVLKYKMPNATERQRFIREARINEIKVILSNKNVLVDRNKFVMEICIKYAVSIRTAKEYIKIAEFLIHNGN